MKTESFHDVNFIVTCGTWGGRFDNLRRHQCDKVDISLINDIDSRFLCAVYSIIMQFRFALFFNVNSLMPSDAYMASVI